jgi:hypothetical protein
MTNFTELQKALTEGRNLVLVNGKPYVLAGFDRSRPKNGVKVRAIESGKEYVCASVLIVGSIDTALLSWPANKPAAEAGAATKPTLPNGVSDFPMSFGPIGSGFAVKAGDKIKLITGEVVEYAGCARNRPKFSVCIIQNGNYRLCPQSMVSEKL